MSIVFIYFKGNAFFFLKDNVHALSRSVTSDSVTPWAVACQAPLLMEFSEKKKEKRKTVPKCTTEKNKIQERKKKKISC